MTYLCSVFPLPPPQPWFHKDPLHFFFMLPKEGDIYDLRDLHAYHCHIVCLDHIYDRLVCFMYFWLIYHCHIICLDHIYDRLVCFMYFWLIYHCHIVCLDRFYDRLICFMYFWLIYIMLYVSWLTLFFIQNSFSLACLDFLGFNFINFDWLIHDWFEGEIFLLLDNQGFSS